MKNESLTENDEKKLGGIISSLKGNPIFRMSLGSKELFHSNFIEYLWYLDQSAFIMMMNALPSRQCNKLQRLKPRNDYRIGREEQNFDICIYHVNDKDKVIYDLVIENKVKSIPYKEQLKDYQTKANNTGCRFILLTLSQDFPDKGNEEIQDWDIVGYDDLSPLINQYYLNGRKQNDPHYHYIKDYLSFIEKLCELKDYTLPAPQNLLSQQLFDDTVIDALKTIRLHDLYIKLRCSWFAMILKKHFKDEAKVVHSFNDIEEGYVNLNVAINQGNGQIAAWICNEETDSNRPLKEKEKKLMNTFEIVIQGSQYRHGINQARFLLDEDDKYKRLVGLYKRLEKLPDPRGLAFLNVSGAKQVRPYFQKKRIPKEGPYNCYGESYIYRYTEISDQDTIERLLNRMMSDINEVLNNPPSLT